MAQAAALAASGGAFCPERLRACRLAAGLSQKELAEMVHAAGGEKTVSNWERGAHEPRPAFLRSLAKTFEVTVPWLRGSDIPSVQKAGKGHGRAEMAVCDFASVGAGKFMHVVDSNLDAACGAGHAMSAAVVPDVDARAVAVAGRPVCLRCWLVVAGERSSRQEVAA